MNTICSIGSINIDRCLTVDHLVRPGETIIAHTQQTHLGGKGLNQAVAASRAGGKVFMAGHIHTNDDWILAKMQNENINCTYLHSGDVPTGEAVIQIDKQGENCIIINSGANQTFKEEQVKLLVQSLEKNSYVLLQNETNLTKELIEQCSRRKDLNIVFNPAPLTDSIRNLPLSSLHSLIVNREEGKALCHLDQPLDILKDLNRRYPKVEIILTLGSEGVFWAQGSQQHFHKAIKTKVVDSTGAGDTFIGYYTYAKAQGKSSFDAIKMGIQAATLSIQKMGAFDSIPLSSQLEAFA